MYKESELRRNVGILLKHLEESNLTAEDYLASPEAEQLMTDVLNLRSDEKHDLKEYVSASAVVTSAQILKQFYQSRENKQNYATARDRLTNKTAKEDGDQLVAGNCPKKMASTEYASPDHESDEEPQPTKRTAAQIQAEAQMMVLRIGLGRPEQDAASSRIFSNTNTHMSSIKFIDSLVQQGKKVLIPIPMTIYLSASAPQGRFYYNEPGPVNSAQPIKVKKFQLTKDKFIAFVRDNMVISTEGINDKYYYPRYVMKSSTGSSSVTKVFHSVVHLAKEVWQNFHIHDCLIQQFIRPKGNRTAVVRYCLKDQKLVYKSLVIQNRDPFDQESPMYQKMLKMIKQQRYEDRVKQASLKQKEAVQSGHRPSVDQGMVELAVSGGVKNLFTAEKDFNKRRGGIFQLLSLPASKKSLARGSSVEILNSSAANSAKLEPIQPKTARPMPHKVGMRKQSLKERVLNEIDKDFNLEGLFDHYARYCTTDEMAEHFILSMKEIGAKATRKLGKKAKDIQETAEEIMKKLYILQCRPSTFPVAQNVSLDLAQYLMEYQVQLMKKGDPLRNIKRFICDFVEGQDGQLYFLAMKSFQLEGESTAKSPVRVPGIMDLKDIKMQDDAYRTTISSMMHSPKKERYQGHTCAKCEKTKAELARLRNPSPPKAMNEDERLDVIEGLMHKKRTKRLLCKGLMCQPPIPMLNITHNDILQMLVENQVLLLKEIPEEPSDFFKLGDTTLYFKYIDLLDIGHDRVANKSHTVSIMQPLVSDEHPPKQYINSPWERQATYSRQQVMNESQINDKILPEDDFEVHLARRPFEPAPEFAKPCIERNKRKNMPLCVVCYSLMQMLTRRHQAMVFLPDSTRETMMRLSYKGQELWDYEDYDQIIKLYKDSASRLSSNSAFIKKHRQNVVAGIGKGRNASVLLPSVVQSSFKTVGADGSGFFKKSSEMVNLKQKRDGSGSPERNDFSFGPESPSKRRASRATIQMFGLNKGDVRTHRPSFLKERSFFDKNRNIQSVSELRRKLMYGPGGATVKEVPNLEQ